MHLLKFLIHMLSRALLRDLALIGVLRHHSWSLVCVPLGLLPSSVLCLLLSMHLRLLLLLHLLLLHLLLVLRIIDLIFVLLVVLKVLLSRILVVFASHNKDHISDVLVHNLTLYTVGR